jgi:hypothetical protein
MSGVRFYTCISQYFTEYCSQIEPRTLAFPLQSNTVKVSIGVVNFHDDHSQELDASDTQETLSRPVQYEDIADKRKISIFYQGFLV